MNRYRLPTDRGGLSLLEALVAIAVVGVLLGLLLGAVQKVRAAAGRAACGNNLRQVALAAHGYHATEQRFPPAFRRPGRGEPFPYLHWQARLAPQLDQENVWRQIAADYARQPNPFVAIPPHAAWRGSPKVLQCPADPSGGEARPVRMHGRTELVAFTSYFGSSGTTTQKADGVLRRRTSASLAAVCDGASSTLFAGERPVAAGERFGWWYAGVGQDFTGALDSLLGVREVARPTHPLFHDCGQVPGGFRPGEPGDRCAVLRFWSHHSGGANFAFCDGSVRFLPYSVDPILPALATRAGGESVQIPD